MVLAQKEGPYLSQVPDGRLNYPSPKARIKDFELDHVVEQYLDALIARR
jgi:hypothetical protein